MGIKRRSMFNPKFKNVRPERWELGRKILGIPTEKELEIKRLEEQAEQARLKAEQEGELRAQTEAKLNAEREATLRSEREATLRSDREATLKAEQEVMLKKKTITRSKPKRRTTKAKTKKKPVD